MIYIAIISCASACRISTTASSTNVEQFTSHPLHNLSPVLDVDPRTEGAFVDATPKEVVEDAIVRLGNLDIVDGGGGGEGAEGEIGGLVVVRIAGIFQILARTDVLQGESLTVRVIDIPDGTVLKVLTVAFRQAEDETAPARLQRLCIQIARLAPDVIFLIVGGDEPQKVSASYIALLQAEEIAGVVVVEGCGIVLVT